LTPVSTCKSSVVAIPLIVLCGDRGAKTSHHNEKATEGNLRRAKALDVYETEHSSSDDQDIIGHSGPLVLVMACLFCLLLVQSQ
jgi:hypothetical protein